MKSKNYNLVHQTTLWDCHNTEVIRLMLFEAKENAYNDEKFLYLVKTYFENVGTESIIGFNDLDSAMHAIALKYRTYLYNSIKAPF